MVVSKLRLGTCVLFAAFAACSVFAQPVSLPPEWEVRKLLDALTEQAKKLKPILEEVKPQEWVNSGAPEAYQTQWKSVREELEYLARTAGELSKNPDRVTSALGVFFRMQAMDSMLDSLERGIRQYQNPALADLLRSAMTENAVHEEKLRQYIVQLAAVKEHELKVMNEEAQRCRTQLSRQPPTKSNSPGKAAPK